MHTSILNSPGNRRSLCKSLVEIINARIQFADYKLKNFMASLLKSGQTPSRPNKQQTAWIDAQNSVFETIENSISHTTKLLYIRANITEYNSETIFQLISSGDFESISLEQLKQKI